MPLPTFRVCVVAGREIAYTDDEAPGAMPNGSRVIKVAGDPGDAHDVGKLGRVIGSMDALAAGYLNAGPAGQRARFFYFVYWDKMPGVPVGVIEWKIAPCV
jgi:hypothetical protein